MTWKVQCRMMLMKSGVWKIVEGTEVAPLPTRDNHAAIAKFSDRRDKALSTIVLAVDPALLYLLGDPQDPVKVWKKLADQFQAKTWANKLALRCKLHRLKLDENRPIQEHIKAMIEIFEELAVIGSPMEEEDRVVQILTSLPDSYNMLVTAFEASSEVPKIEIVTERLLNEERKIKEKRGAVRGVQLSGEALFTSSRQKTCFYCGETGHIKKFCEKWKKSNESEENKSPAAANFLCHQSTRRNIRSDSESSDECLALVSRVADVKREKWFLDSAASRHLCKNRKMFQSVRRLRFPKSVKVGDGSVVTAKFQGTIKMKIRSGSGIVRFRMKDVLYVPGLKYILLSVSQASESGKAILFDKFGAQIKDISSGKTVGTATRIGELYEVDTVSEEVSKHISRDQSNFKGMEQALLCIKENNFTEEIMKRLDRIEEDKSKLTERLTSVEEDMSYSNSSYPVIKEDVQNQQDKLRQLNYLKDLEEKFYNQEVYSEEEEYSDQEDCYEQSEIRKQEDQQEEQGKGSDQEDQEDSYEDSDEDDRESVDSEVYNCVTLEQVFKSMSDVSTSAEADNNPLVTVPEPSEIHEQSPSNSKGKCRKLRNRVVSLKNRFSRLFRCY